MHRTLEITVAPTATDQLLKELVGLDGVIGVAVSRGASHKPVGDVITVHALNRDTDEVLTCVRLAEADGPISVVMAEVASIIDPAKQERIDDDVDEAIWEEMETGLRHQGRVTVNFLTLVALGGAIRSRATTRACGAAWPGIRSTRLSRPDRGRSPRVSAPAGLRRGDGHAVNA